MKLKYEYYKNNMTKEWLVKNGFNTDNGIEKYAKIYYSGYGNHKEILKIIRKKFHEELTKLKVKI